MNFTIYEGDGQEIPVKNELEWISGEFILESVLYLAKPTGKKKWYGVLGNGTILEVSTKNIEKMKKVGKACKFHRDLSRQLDLNLFYEKINHAEICLVLKTRKRKLWEKEYRAKKF